MSGELNTKHVDLIEMPLKSDMFFQMASIKSSWLREITTQIAYYSNGKLSTTGMARISIHGPLWLLNEMIKTEIRT